MKGMEGVKIEILKDMIKRIHLEKNRSIEKNVTCCHCNKPGHLKKECRILKKEQNKGKKNEKKDEYSINSR